MKVQGIRHVWEDSGRAQPSRDRSTLRKLRDPILWIPLLPGSPPKFAMDRKGVSGSVRDSLKLTQTGLLRLSANAKQRTRITRQAAGMSPHSPGRRPSQSTKVTGSPGVFSCVLRRRRDAGFLWSGWQTCFGEKVLRLSHQISLQATIVLLERRSWAERA